VEQRRLDRPDHRVHDGSGVDVAEVRAQLADQVDPLLEIQPLLAV
jgi:hypothetical protein